MKKIGTSPIVRITTPSQEIHEFLIGETLYKKICSSTESPIKTLPRYALGWVFETKTFSLKDVQMVAKSQITKKSAKVVPVRAETKWLDEESAEYSVDIIF